MANAAESKTRRTGRTQKHVPVRTCVACRRKDAKRQYVRLVRTPERTVEVDPTGKANGRGAYLCRSRRCWYDALSSGAIERALNVELDQVDKDRLREYARTHFPPDDD